MDKRVRVRFAPSPTGPLHLGGVRTALYNYLFARQHGGDFILRIEDTDQTRWVPGAEEYIMQCLSWCGLEPDESPVQGGAYGPYRQSDRKESYRRHAEELVALGHAYYAFDTPEEIESMRQRLKSDANPSPQYDRQSRGQMRNSLTLPPEEVKALLEAGTPHVIRFLMPASEEVVLDDLVRGRVSFQTDKLDDKVLLKADGMPTYHLAVVVDDHAMKVTHVFRGEEWLPSTPLHVLLWRRLGWEAEMPAWAHLPLILKPDGHGKLSKRDGDRLGFPVFPMNWTDPKTGELSSGFREMGFLPQAFVNMLAMLGWNDGTEQEVFSLAELIDRFSVERVHKGGAKFNFEKAKWYNQEHLKLMSTSALLPVFRDILQAHDLQDDDQRLLDILDLIKERCVLLPDLWDNSVFFFRRPQDFDLAGVLKKWDGERAAFFQAWAAMLPEVEPFDAMHCEERFKAFAEQNGFKAGGMMLPFRIMLVGGKFGPPVFDIVALLGKEETAARIEAALPVINRQMAAG